MASTTMEVERSRSRHGRRPDRQPAGRVQPGRRVGAGQRRGTGYDGHVHALSCLSPVFQAKSCQRIKALSAAMLMQVAHRFLTLASMM